MSKISSAELSRKALIVFVGSPNGFILSRWNAISEIKIVIYVRSDRKNRFFFCPTISKHWDPAGHKKRGQNKVNMTLAGKNEILIGQKINE